MICREVNSKDSIKGGLDINQMFSKHVKATCIPQFIQISDHDEPMYPKIQDIQNQINDFFKIGNPNKSIDINKKHRSNTLKEQ